MSGRGLKLHLSADEVLLVLNDDHPKEAVQHLARRKKTLSLLLLINMLYFVYFHIINDYILLLY